MSRQFKATAVYITTGAATSVGHEGENYVNPDYPIGSIIAIGDDGEWYTHNQPQRMAGAEDWLSPGKDGKYRFWRDGWRITFSGSVVNDDGSIRGDQSPYAKAIRNAPKRFLGKNAPNNLLEAAKAALAFLGDKSFIPDSDTHLCTKICDQLDAAIKASSP